MYKNTFVYRLPAFHGIASCVALTCTIAPLLSKAKCRLCGALLRPGGTIRDHALVQLIRKSAKTESNFHHNNFLRRLCFTVQVSRRLREVNHILFHSRASICCFTPRLAFLASCKNTSSIDFALNCCFRLKGRVECINAPVNHNRNRLQYSASSI